MKSCISTPQSLSRWCVCVLLLTGMLMCTGCNAIGFIGAMIESKRRNSTKTIDAEYKGLKGKEWAVVVVADRSIQAEFSEIVPYLTGKITERLVAEQPKIAAAGVVPTERVLRYLFDHPSWISMPHGELARELQVNRLIVVELIEYRLNDPGNQYLWSGMAAGTVGVVEADSSMKDEFAFQKAIRVQFPDKGGYGPNEYSRAVVATALGQRFIDRTSWLFYSHLEPYYPKY